MMNLSDPSMRLLAASGGDTVKLFDVSDDGGDPCTLSYTPSPGYQVNCVKWNHTNLVVASAGDDKKISLWRKNGQSLGSIAVSDGIDNIEETISTISFSNKGSRYICSGGSGKVVRIWDLQRKRCIKWLRGHTDTITGAMYNCKDEHLASISLNGDIILFNLASGGRPTELKDPNQQVLRVLDYSRVSRHLLVTAGDDGSVHLWDTTGRSPKVSWLKQHSAPTAGVCFSPSNDKVIASVGLDKKLYTFDTGTRRPSFCIPYEAPFSSVAFRDDGHILAAGTSGGRVVFYDVRAKPLPLTVLRAYGNSEAVASLSWQRSKPEMVHESNCTSETALLGSGAEDSILMPDPLPSAPSSTSTPPSSQINPIRSSSYTDSFSFPSGSLSTSFSADETTPIRSSLWSGANLSRLHAPRGYDMKDDMDVFSPLVEVQPITPSLDKLWDEIGGNKKDLEKKPSLLFPSSRTFSLPDDFTAKDSHPILDWKSNLSPKQDDTLSFKSEDSAAITPPEEWGGGRLSDKYTLNRQAINLPPRFANLTSTGLSTGSMISGFQDMTMSTSSKPSFTNMGSKGNTSSNVDPSLGFPEHVPLTSAPSLGTSLTYPRRYSSYAERISSNPSFSDGTSLPAASPKIMKTGANARDELLNGPISRSDVSTTSDPVILPSLNVTPRTPAAASQIDSQQGTSFMLQLFQRTLEETLGSFQKSVHEDIRNLHIEVLRQFHMHEMETSKVMGPLVENVEELRNEVQSLRNEVQQLRQSLLQ